MEGTRVEIAIESLNYARSWLEAQDHLPWQDDLILRLDLRKVRILFIAFLRHGESNDTFSGQHSFCCKYLLNLHAPM